MAEPTAYEQLFLELINRARLDPAAEAARLGVSLGTITTTQKQPLAFNTKLNDAADAHSAWMLAADVFSHTGSGGSSPYARMQAAGYTFSGSWSWGENIAWNGTTGTLNLLSSTLSQYSNLFKSSGHRANMLNDGFKEAGIGSVTGQYGSYNALMTTQDFARSGTGSFVTGVAFNDSNADAFYSVGEGRGAIQTQLMSGASTLGTTATWASGGYALKTTAAGQLTVKFSGGGLAQTVGATVAVGASNVKVDLVNGDTIQSSATATLFGSTANLTLLGINAMDGTGNAAANTLTGNKGVNLLQGLDGNDALRGGDSADLLIGGSGNDSLTGGAHNDTFVFQGLTGTDHIMDFQDGIDRIRFTQAGGDDFFDLKISNNGSTSVSVVHDGGTIIVAGTAPITLSASDFDFLA